MGENEKLPPAQLSTDLISRQAAIEAINKAFERVFAWDGTSPLGDKVLENVPSAQPEQQWIPCSERLPEEGQGCLVCDKGSILIDTFIGHGNPYNWKWYIRDYEAWMPLPEPYTKRRGK